jgi:hypothetical protein
MIASFNKAVKYWSLGSEYLYLVGIVANEIVNHGNKWDDDSFINISDEQ